MVQIHQKAHFFFHRTFRGHHLRTPETTNMQSAEIRYYHQSRVEQSRALPFIHAIINAHRIAPTISREMSNEQSERERESVSRCNY